MSQLASDELKIEIGERIKAVRTSLHLTQAEFATRLEITPRSLLNYELGEREAPTSLMIKLHRLFGIDPVWLLTGPRDTLMDMRAARLNERVIAEILTLRDAEQKRIGKRISPEAKALIVRTGYEHYIATGSVSGELIARTVEIAAASAGISRKSAPGKV